MDVEVGFENMVPSGTTIQAKEVSRKGESGKDLIAQYHIFVAGVPANTLFKHVECAVNAEKAHFTPRRYFGRQRRHSNVCWPNGRTVW